MKKKIKIEIKNRWKDSIVFEYSKKDNTIKDTLEEARKRCADLGDADLRGADLRGADLGDAYLLRAYLGGADLRDAYLGDAKLGGAYLRCADLGDAYLGCADLGGADLGGANLLRAYLSGADLRCAYLGGAYLRGADLRGADLRGADLRGADLLHADLGGADLGGADLRCADLRDADLRGAELGGAYLGGADLGDANNIPLIPISCPSDGAFIAWKKVDEYLVKLLIPEDARRCSASSRKCRCDKAKVLEITSIVNANESIEALINNNYCKTLYKVGEFVYPDSFDENRWNECSHGIHFFINKEEAIRYNY